MKIFFRAFLVFILILFSAASVDAAAIIIDNNSVDQFSSIPSSTLTTLTNSYPNKKLILLRHASVGGNVNSGLTGLVDNTHSRTNFVFQSRGNPGWKEKVDDFVTQTASQLNSFDIFTMKFCYIDNATPSTVWNYYRDKMLYLEQTYPSKKFVWWTMPIMTTGNANRDGFNKLVRDYAIANNKILFDIADIESKGKTVTNGGYEAMHSSYSSDGGHLNAAGSAVAAKAFWVLMARLSGWNPNGISPTIAPTAVPPTPTPIQPTPTSIPGVPTTVPTVITSYKTGDLNHDGKVDNQDVGLLISVYLRPVSTLPDADLNHDGKINAIDYAMITQLIGT